ncbi:hypothetical protein ACS0TY_014331 [Phlomoides rotata]
MKKLMQLKGYTDHMVEDAKVVIFTFGSYRLGVCGTRADIDTLRISPSYVTREEATLTGSYLASTYCALAILKIVGYELSLVDCKFLSNNQKITI